ncbi:hypothetical protein [Lysobacter capsici]|uniref:hypothetical protein n=1 Tax=Lysobacter capsici TaxID=435897 RepID=UPI0009E1B9B2|nr:hypothetical protein [Lysobacter capsici]
MNFSSRSDLIGAIDKLMKSEGSEEELDGLLNDLCEWAVMPKVSDMIFYPEEDLTAEEIADRILSYKPVLL